VVGGLSRSHHVWPVFEDNLSILGQLDPPRYFVVVSYSHRISFSLDAELPVITRLCFVSDACVCLANFPTPCFGCGCYESYGISRFLRDSMGLYRFVRSRRIPLGRGRGGGGGGRVGR